MAGMKKWLDIDALDGIYRSVLEADRIYLDADKENTLFNGKIYNRFVEGKDRQVWVFKSVDSQTKFKLAGYRPDSREEVNIYVDGVRTPPAKLENDYIHVGQPLAAGLEIVIHLTGVPYMYNDPTSPSYNKDECRVYPTSKTCTPYYPTAPILQKSAYVFHQYYAKNESVVCLRKKLKRVNVTVDQVSGETVQQALERVIGLKDDCYTVINGQLYVSYNLNGFPMKINYNYKAGSVIKNRQNEPIRPHSSCARYQDRFFPYITVTRAEFFMLLQRMRENFYNRYTDRGYTSSTVRNMTRYLADRSAIVGKWYEQEILNILEEKFMDGCYVFPLYDDDTFEPDGCMTRAEMVVHLHRFAEWALERFR